MTAGDVAAYRVGEEGDPERMLVALAAYYGIGREVRQMLQERGAKAPGLHKGGLAKVLQTQRRVNNMTIQEVHERCGIARSQIGHYEAHAVKNPGLRTLQALAYGYRLPFALVLVSALQDINPHMRARFRE